mmetsp:Transcript_921/g.1310  ORF Transcript_921/g.1310 Transcript_921/m.1310 type:complete len:95 (+) Transcript_921:766-1050(+)
MYGSTGTSIPSVSPLTRHMLVYHTIRQTYTYRRATDEPWMKKSNRIESINHTGGTYDLFGSVQMDERATQSKKTVCALFTTKQNDEGIATRTNE